MSPAWFAVLCALAISTAASIDTTAASIVQLDHAIFARDTELTFLKNASLAFNKTNDNLGTIDAGPISINVTCNSCQTFGTAQLSRSGLTCNEKVEDFIKDLEKNHKNLTEVEQDIRNFLSTELQIEFVDTGAVFDMNIAVSGQGTHGFNLITLPLVPLGDSFHLKDVGKATLGVILSLDLIFDFAGGAAVNTTFDVTIPSGASILIDTISGKILSFPGFADSKLNVTNTSIGDFFADFLVSLRATIVAGADIDIEIPDFKRDFTIETGFFVDLVKHEANFTSADQHALKVRTLPSTTTVFAAVQPPITNGTVGGPKGGCVTESLSIDLGGFLIVTDNSTNAADHFDESGSIDLLTYPLPQRCF